VSPENDNLQWGSRNLATGYLTYVGSSTPTGDPLRGGAMCQIDNTFIFSIDTPNLAIWQFTDTTSATLVFRGFGDVPSGGWILRKYLLFIVSKPLLTISPSALGQVTINSCCGEVYVIDDVLGVARIHIFMKGGFALSWSKTIQLDVDSTAPSPDGVQL